MNIIFEEENTDAVLLVDASDAFNSINRIAFVHNIKSLCPAIATYCYSRKSRLFVDGCVEIKSEEGTTQGDPLAMPTYAIGILPLQELLQELLDEDPVKSVTFADNFAGAGKLQSLRSWWNAITRLGPLLGYYPKASKSWLIVKEVEKLNEAEQIFAGTDVKVTVSGKKYLGGTIGTETFKEKYFKERVSEWIEQIKMLSEIAKSQPQCAYSAFVGGFIHKFTYHLRVLGDIEEYLTPLDNAIDSLLIPALTEGHRCSPLECRLLALPEAWEYTHYIRHCGA